jgi:hypothetical protein
VHAVATATATAASVAALRGAALPCLPNFYHCIDM